MASKGCTLSTTDWATLLCEVAGLLLPSKGSSMQHKLGLRRPLCATRRVLVSGSTFSASPLRCESSEHHSFQATRRWEVIISSSHQIAGSDPTRTPAGQFVRITGFYFTTTRLFWQMNSMTTSLIMWLFRKTFMLLIYFLPIFQLHQVTTIFLSFWFN